MLRLLISSYFYPPSIGGVERQTHLLARGLARRGHRVRVVAARLPGSSAHEDLEGVEVVRVAAGAGSRWTRMATYLAGLATELAWARSWAQLVQVQQALYPAAAAALVTRALGLPLVVSNRGSGVAGAVSVMRGLPLGPLALRLIAGSAACIGVNDEAVDELRSLGAQRVRRINNGVELPDPSPAGREQARAALGLAGPVALFLGRLEPEKDLEGLLEAWIRGAPPGTLAVVGDGSLRPLVEGLASRARPGSVRVIGAVRDPSPWLRAADVLVLPSKSEGTSNSLLEAMGHGVAPIATAVAGNRMVLDRPGLGRLVPPGDADALAAALGELLADPALCARLGEAARASVRERFSVEAMVAAHERLYAEVLAGFSAAAPPPPPAART